MSQINPSHNLERELFAAGYSAICGIDEVGRGAWAGPLVAAAVLINAEKLAEVDWTNQDLPPIRDSKKLNKKQREEAANWLQANFDWGIGAVENQEIDFLGLGPANVLAFQRSVQNAKLSPSYYLLDGQNYTNYFQPGQSIVGGDAKVWLIAAASIVAKVWRDRLMAEFSEIYPQYNFSGNVGYGTKEHQAALIKHGVCKIHRRSYEPIKKIEKGKLRGW